MILSQERMKLLAQQKNNAKLEREALTDTLLHDKYKRETLEMIRN